MTHAINAFDIPPAEDGPLMVWAAELDEIGFESACPSLQGVNWHEVAPLSGDLADAA
jgi:hypothetical protein